jgi:hypothetical protein
LALGTPKACVVSDSYTEVRGFHGEVYKMVAKQYYTSFFNWSQGGKSKNFGNSSQTFFLPAAHDSWQCFSHEGQSDFMAPGIKRVKA